MKYILGVDPGRKGGFCLMAGEGAVLGLWPMPLIAGKVAAQAIANLYHEIRGSLPPTDKPRCYIEKVQAMPHDGKVGMCSYWKGAGYLEMVSLWKWPVILVPPGTWCKKMHAGLPASMKPKDRSKTYISQHRPELYIKGSDLWPSRCKDVHDGMMDALMIAEYGRIKENA